MRPPRRRLVQANIWRRRCGVEGLRRGCGRAPVVCAEALKESGDDAVHNGVWRRALVPTAIVLTGCVTAPVALAGAAVLIAGAAGWRGAGSYGHR